MQARKKAKKRSIFYIVIIIFSIIIAFLAGFYLGLILYNNSVFNKSPQAKISLGELKSKIDKGEGFVLLDLRSPEEYEKDHLPHATMAPYSAFERPNIIARISPLLDKRDEFILYCRSSKCKTSEVAARQLIGLGFNNVKVLDGGMDEWKVHGWPTEKGK